MVLKIIDESNGVYKDYEDRQKVDWQDLKILGLMN